MAEKKLSVFETLSKIDCTEYIEKKNNLSYLSWAWAWQIVKQNYPFAEYTIYENKDGLNYHTDSQTCWVKTGVTIDGLEHIEYLPVMDFRNASIRVDKVTSFDVNKAIQRSLTKACARHGLGLYIYAGEDLPQDEDKGNEQSQQQDKPRLTESMTAYKSLVGRFEDASKTLVEKKETLKKALDAYEISQVIVGKLEAIINKEAHA